jgi:hypothetical protein
MLPIRMRSPLMTRAGAGTAVIRFFAAKFALAMMTITD